MLAFHRIVIRVRFRLAPIWKPLPPTQGAQWCLHCLGATIADVEITIYIHIVDYVDYSRTIYIYDIISLKFEER